MFPFAFELVAPTRIHEESSSGHESTTILCVILTTKVVYSRSPSSSFKDSLREGCRRELSRAQSCQSWTNSSKRVNRRQKTLRGFQQMGMRRSRPGGSVDRCPSYIRLDLSHHAKGSLLYQERPCKKSNRSEEPEEHAECSESHQEGAAILR